MGRDECGALHEVYRETAEYLRSGASVEHRSKSLESADCSREGGVCPQGKRGFIDARKESNERFRSSQSRREPRAGAGHGGMCYSEENGVSAGYSDTERNF